MPRKSRLTPKQLEERQITSARISELQRCGKAVNQRQAIRIALEEARRREQLKKTDDGD